jgi:diguanylate cyclase (GGDEF)-like protein
LDLDDFKAVNDTLGHAAGDELLVEVTRRLKNSVYPTDTLCRLGGDEFAVLLGSVDADSGRRSAERLLSLISENFSIAGRSIRVSASVGVAVLDGSWSVASEVLTAADQAMYAAKRQGKSCVILHEHHMSLAAARHGQLTQALREGLLLGEVSVAYQPIVELCSGTALGFEALARWHNPVHGQINPVEFVALAEGSGAIHELGQLVLETGCRDIASVNATRNPDDRPLGLAVNVSTVQLKRRDLVHDVVRALQASGLPAALLTVEITEGTALSADCLPVLNEIRALGVGVALDDFGTGFASLTHVTSLPITQLKIDRSFVDDLIDRDGDALIAAVLALGRQLDLEVVAEGVETEAQRARLEELGCVRAQGYLFARPMTIDALRVHMAPDEPRLRLLPG